MSVDPVAQVLLNRYNEQVDAYYALPEDRWGKSSMTFSPSEAELCPRQLYYMYTKQQPNEPKPRIPLQSRVPDVGHGLHHQRQYHLKQMPDLLRKKGITPAFRVKKLDDGTDAIECKFEREINHKNEVFKIRGRLDAILEVFDENGEKLGDVVWDLKAKTLKKKLKQLDREVKKYVSQMVCYRILTDIPHALIEFESAQKDWSKDGPNDDVARVILTITDEQVKEILDKFSYVAACVRTKTLASPERDDYYCKNFCSFSEQCHIDSLGTDV